MQAYTSCPCNSGVPRALIGHRVVMEQHRPPIPPELPDSLKDLFEECWDKRMDRRPTFSDILSRLQAIRDELPYPTPALDLMKLTKIPKLGSILEADSCESPVKEAADKDEEQYHDVEEDVIVNSGAVTE